MLAGLAERSGVSRRGIARALPEERRAFAGPEAFDAVGQSLTGWESAAFIAFCGGWVLEIKRTIPTGAHGHGDFNLKGGPRRAPAD